MAIQPKINYLNNRELLREIHNSKCSYSSFLDDKYKNFDFFIDKIEDITDDLLKEVKIKKSLDDLQKKIYDLKRQGIKINKNEMVPQDPNTIKDEDVVFRMQTYEHVPLLEGEELDKALRKLSEKAGKEINLEDVINDKEVREKTIFLPWVHLIKKDGEFVVVGKSHWKDGLENGHFCQTHGNITNKLAEMFLLLVEKIGQKGNWRGYCVDDQTEILTQDGWKNHTSIDKNDIVLSYNENHLVWSAITGIFKYDFDGDMYELKSKTIDALVTPNHKFLTTDGLKEIDYINDNDTLILMGNNVQTFSSFHNSFVKIIGYIIKFGTIMDNTMMLNIPTGYHLYSIKNDFMNIEYNNYEIMENDKMVTILIKNFKEKFNVSSLSHSFVNLLTQHQRLFLIELLLDENEFKTKSKEYSDAFVHLCVLAGFQTQTKNEDDCYITKILYSSYHNDAKSIDIKNDTHYKGLVWCIQTEFGSFICRRNGLVYLTGNSYVSEMKAQAIIQLVQRGLYFDDNRYDNPFAYYTSLINNAFTRVLNIEKKNQDIRDDLLIINGATPSYTRQIDNEFEQKE